MLISLLHGTPEPVTASTLHVTSIQSHVKSARRSADLLTERLKYEVCSAMELPAAGDSLLIVVACEYREYVLPPRPSCWLCWVAESLLQYQLLFAMCGPRCLPLTAHIIITNMCYSIVKRRTAQSSSSECATS